MDAHALMAGWKACPTNPGRLRKSRSGVSINQKYKEGVFFPVMRNGKHPQPLGAAATANLADGNGESMFVCIDPGPPAMLVTMFVAHHPARVDGRVKPRERTRARFD